MIRVEINGNENRKNREINITESWFLEKINKTDKPLAKLTKKKEDTNCQFKYQKKIKGYPYGPCGRQKETRGELHICLTTETK